jgi:hypothetical protein
MHNFAEQQAGGGGVVVVVVVAATLTGSVVSGYGPDTVRKVQGERRFHDHIRGGVIGARVHWRGQCQRDEDRPLARRSM